VKPLRIEDVTGLLPQVDELQPLLARLIASSTVDPERRWTASGELGTIGERLADPARVRPEVAGLVRDVAIRTEQLYDTLLDALESLPRGARAARGGGGAGIKKKQPTRTLYISCIMEWF
jgi:hypothetical protein